MSSLIKAWRKIVQEQPDALAITAFPEETTLTFEELDRKANELRDQLTSAFADTEGKIVGVKIERRELWMATFLAILKSKAIVLPIDTTATDEETQRLLHNIDCNAWFHQETFTKLHDRTAHHFKKAKIQIFKVTSGSTATPKILAFTESQMVADARNILSTKGITEHDIQFATIPLGHSYGLGSLVYPFFLKGIALAFNSIPLPGIIEKELKLSHSTVMPTIPGVLKALARSENVQLPKSLRLVISAASPLTAELAIDFYQRHGLRIHNFYGSSETGGVAYDRDGKALPQMGAVGAPLNGVKVSISRNGRVKVESEAVFTHRNRNRNEKQGQFLLSDYGTLKNNLLFLKGRSNRIIKHHGKRIDLSQIEKILTEHPNINEAFVAYEPNRHRIVAAIAGELNSTEFAIYAEKHLSIWKRPKQVCIVNTLPVNARGKPDRSAILSKISSEGIALKYEG